MLQHQSISYFRVVPIKHSRHSKHSRVRCHDAAFSASVCKIIANTTTYPLETFRLLSLNAHRPVTAVSPSILFKGISTYIPFCITTNMIVFKVFYGLHGVVTTFIKDTWISMLITSVMTSFLSSCYRIPYSYYLKNRILTDHVDFKHLYTSGIYTKALLATMCEDVPELILRTVVAQHLTQHMLFLGHSHFIAALVVALIVSIVISPIDYWKTCILCGRIKLRFSPLSVCMAVCINVLRLMLYQSLMILIPV